MYIYICICMHAPLYAIEADMFTYICTCVRIKCKCVMLSIFNACIYSKLSRMQICMYVYTFACPACRGKRLPANRFHLCSQWWPWRPRIASSHQVGR